MQIFFLNMTKSKDRATASPAIMSSSPRTAALGDARVLAQAATFLDLMTSLGDRDQIRFRTFSTTHSEPLRRLCSIAARECNGGADAPASLTILPGAQNLFTIEGTHARATLRQERAPSVRLAVLLCALGVVLLAWCLAKRRYL